MVSSVRRPADLVLEPYAWGDTDAAFGLEGLEFSESAAVLLQWALANHFRAEIRRSGYDSPAQFARVYDLSYNLLSNFLSGHRKANFRDVAVLLEVLGPRAWPDPSHLAAQISQARARSIGGEAPGMGPPPTMDGGRINSPPPGVA